MSDSEELKTVVKRVLRKNNVELKGLFQNVFQTIAGEFWAAELIEKEVVDSMQITGVDTSTPAAKLFDACYTLLVQSPEENFPKFIKVLKKYETMKQLVKDMESEFEQARKAGGSVPLMQVADASQHSASHPPIPGKSMVSQVILTIDDLRIVMNELRKFDKGNWKKLGRELGLSAALLGEVNADYNREGVSECLAEMLKHWLNMNYDESESKPPTWSNLADAVKETGNPTLANTIREHHRS